MAFASPLQEDEEDLLVGAEVFHGGAPRPDLPPQDVVEDLAHVLLPLQSGGWSMKTQSSQKPTIQIRLGFPLTSKSIT